MNDAKKFEYGKKIGEFIPKITEEQAILILGLICKAENQLPND